MKDRYPLILIYLFLTLLPFNPAHTEELVIITAKDNSVDIALDDINRIFLGKTNTYPDGKEAIPLNISPADPHYANFARTVLKKSPSQLRAYWAKRVFTGKGKPPKIISNTEELLELIGEDQRYISYIGSQGAGDDVRWIIVINNDES